MLILEIMIKALLLTALLLLTGCYQTGYQPHYMISQEEAADIPLPDPLTL